MNIEAIAFIGGLIIGCLVAMGIMASSSKPHAVIVAHGCAEYVLSERGTSFQWKDRP